MNNPIYTPLEALEAIKARINGVWDNPQLERLGDLFVSPQDDIERIIDCVPDLVDNGN